MCPSLHPKYLFYKTGMGRSPTRALWAPSWPVPPLSAAKGWLGPLCPWPSQAVHPPAAPPLPHPPQASGAGSRLGVLPALRDTPTPALPWGSPEGPARQRGAGAERQPGGGRGRPAREAGGGRQRGDRSDKPAAPRAAPTGPSGSQKPNSNIRRGEEWSGAGRGGGPTQAGGVLRTPCMVSLG